MKSTERAKRDWVIEALERKGLVYVDKRSNGGCLWVYGEDEIAGQLRELERRGARFTRSYKGGKATKGQPAWWMTGYPVDRNSPPAPASCITKKQLSRIKPGDVVTHVSYGQGRVVCIDNEYIEVVFTAKSHRGDPIRKFLFPSAFQRGLLRIG